MNAARLDSTSLCEKGWIATLAEMNPRSVGRASAAAGAGCIAPAICHACVSPTGVCERSATAG